MTWKIHEGDALTVLRGMPSERFHACVTSPPYWGLRDYGTARWEGGVASCEHKGRPKPRQDTSGGGPDKGRFAQTRGTQAANAIHCIPVRDVCRCGARRVDLQLGLEETPELFVARLVEIFREVWRVLRPDGACWLNLGDCYSTKPYGDGHTFDPKYGGRNRRRGYPNRHPVPGLKHKDLAGIPWRVAFALQADGWWLRSDVIWAKPNPMPESVRDRPTKAHEYVFLLTKGERYHYDADAIAETAGWPEGPGNVRPVRRPPEQSAGADGNTRGRLHEIGPRETRNARSVWSVATRPYTEAHFATFPPELARRCVLSACPPGGTVLDPFAGAGTTLMVAARLGRHAEGIELNPEYAAMARRRITRDAPLFNTQEVTA